MFAEFELDGIPIEVGAQAEHVHRRLGAATLGIDRILNTEGDAARNRLAAAVARGEDWLEAALEQLGISGSPPSPSHRPTPTWCAASWACRSSRSRFATTCCRC